MFSNGSESKTVIKRELTQFREVTWRRNSHFGDAFEVGGHKGTASLNIRSRKRL
jgi:hypothetical protein